MLEYLTFLAKRRFADENIRAYSAPLADLLAELSGKNIAIIGNSRALEKSNCGDAIDAADLVIRINRAPMPSPSSHGTKTNWLALATRLKKTNMDRIKADRILWMSPKRKRLSFALAKSPGFYLFPLGRVADLGARLQAPPTTGLMIIDLVAGSDAASISLYGFDHFESLSLSGRRTSAQVPHDFSSEKDFVEQLCLNDHRVSLNT